MRILFLTQVLPYPLDAGPKIRAYYALRYLSQKHEVSLASFVRPDDPPMAVEHLQTFCQTLCTVPMHRSRGRDSWDLLRSLISSTPFLIARDWVPGMVELISQLLSQSDYFDVIHADQLWMAPYALLAQRSAVTGPRPAVVLDQHNAVFQIPRRLAQHENNRLKRALLALEGRKLAGYEAKVCQRFDHVVWVTREDQQALGREQSTIRNTEHPICNTVIPICVDPDEKKVIRRRCDAHRVTFLGGLHWPPNAEGIAWLARDVWPLIQQQVPDAVLTVIGKHPPSQLMQYAACNASCEATGYVDDLLPYLVETAVFIVPLHAGGGMRVKILDAWCWGLPVVSTRVGAEGIRVQEGENALLADSADAFAQAVVRVLREPVLAARLAVGGRRAVEVRYDWRKVYRAWDEVYEGTRRKKESGV